MALPTLNLDDLDYQQLLEILRGYLPVQDWSDHNPSDPGIALLELIAWLAEMDLYRMNRVPKAHQDKFLKLLVDPPVPVTAQITLGLPGRATPNQQVALSLPPGLRFASDYRNGRRTIFESYTQTTLKLLADGSQEGGLRLRAIRDLGDVLLGVSDGSPNQTFAIPDGPVLLDRGALNVDYNPNPRLRVVLYDLLLMSVAAINDLQNQGSHLIIVALVGTDLHIRMFDTDGNKVVDKAENELVSGITLTALKQRLNSFPDNSSLSEKDKQEIIQDATSIAGQPDEWELHGFLLTPESQVYPYDLFLMSVPSTNGLLNQGRNLMVVALVGTDLHIRIFDANGKKLIDKAESDLVSGVTLTALKQRLSPFPDNASLPDQDKQKIIRDAASVASLELPHHFMVDEFENQVRFGDGVYGVIPPKGAKIWLISCQILEGPESLVAEGEVKHFLNPEIATGLVPGESLKPKANADAEGGENFFPPDERIKRGLEEFRNPTRLVTAADFERVVTQDFNTWQQGFNSAVGSLPDSDGIEPKLVKRATALMNRKPLLDTDTLATDAGHVTLMILPTYNEGVFESATTSFADKTLLATPSLGLIARLLAYLEPRRLITTRLHIMPVELQAISVQLVVVVESQQKQSQMEDAVGSALRNYLSITHGYDDKRGWPLGRAVRRSELFRILEDVPGVDYVESLVLSPANAQGDIELSSKQLPVWDSLANITIKRA